MELMFHLNQRKIMKTLTGFILLGISLILLPILGIPAFIIGLVRERRDLFKYIKTIAITIDQVGAAIFYGVEDFTMSSWTHYRAKQGHTDAILFEKLIDFLASAFEKNHCKNSYYNELKDFDAYKNLK